MLLPFPFMQLQFLLLFWSRYVAAAAPDSCHRWDNIWPGLPSVSCCPWHSYLCPTSATEVAAVAVFLGPLMFFISRQLLRLMRRLWKAGLLVKLWSGLWHWGCVAGCFQPLLGNENSVIKAVSPLLDAASPEFSVCLTGVNRPVLNEG